MSELDGAVKRVNAEFVRLPEIDTVEGCQVYDKVGRAVVVFDSSRHADAFVSMMIGLLDVFDEAPRLVAEVGEVQKVACDLRDRIDEQVAVIAGLRKIIADQRIELDLMPEKDDLIAGLRKTVSDLRRKLDL